MRRLVVFAVALLVPAFAVACGGGEERTTAPSDQGGVQETDTGPQETEPGTTEETETGATETGGGGEGEGDPEAGREVFTSAGCGGCHTYEPAGTSGTVGPNLDEAQPSYEDARAQIEAGGGGMPAYEGDLSEEEIANVTAFVTQSGR